MRQRVLSLVTAYIKEHPGLVVSISYICLSYVGAIFAYNFYYNFNIPILDLAEISDFLTFGIREPFTIVLLLGAAFVTALLNMYQNQVIAIKYRWRDSDKKWKKRASKLITTGPTKESSQMIILGLVLFLYGFLFVKVYADKSAQYVKEGYGVYFVDKKTSASPEIMLGSTVNYVFLYNPENQSSRIVPVESIDQLQPVKRVDRPTVGRTVKRWFWSAVNND